MAGEKPQRPVAKTEDKRPAKRASTLGVKARGTPRKGQCIEVDEDDTLRKVFGTVHPEVAHGLISHCLKVLKSDEASDDAPGNDERMFMVAAVAEMAPRDAFERLLAVQMAATHVAMVRSGRWLANAENIPQVTVHYNGFTKLARAYAAQMEALRKHRSGGKQTVTVQHVNVADGGQAIVGAVETGGRVRDGT